VPTLPEEGKEYWRRVAAGGERIPVHA
jgi:hypothetical protein